MIEILLPSIVASLCFLTAVWFALGGPRDAPVVRWTLGFAFFFAMATGLEALQWQVLFTALALAMCRFGGSPVVVRRTAAAAAMLAAFALFIHNGTQRARDYAGRQALEVAALREQYPLQSIADRLAYETAGRPVQHEAVSDDVALSPEVAQRLQDSEMRSLATPRGQMLAKAFRPMIAAPVFVTNDAFHRRSDVYYGNMTRAETRSISLTELPPRRGCDPPPTPPTPEYQPTPSPSESPAPLLAMREFHESGARDFLDAERFGYVQDRDHVAGFEPHAFQNMPSLGTHREPVGDWSLDHVDLVSLRKPSGPHVYVSENLPKLDELKMADTRLLDDFETRALAQLRTDEDTVIEVTDGVVRMLGSLRAGNQCITCHAARRGELIGALSYELHRKPSSAVKVAQR